MNLECKPDYAITTLNDAYKYGHRDARHAAAELVANFAAARAQAGGLTEEYRSRLENHAKCDDFPHMKHSLSSAVRAALSALDSLAAENATLKEQLADRERECERLRDLFDETDCAAAEMSEEADAAAEHFDEDGDLRGNGQWRIRQIHRSVRAIQSVFNRMVVEHSRIKANIAPAAVVDCPRCEGEGEIHDADFSDGDSDQQMYLKQDTLRECPKCKGTGIAPAAEGGGE
jgi:chromosome segregation ATPase